jgi:hypothetical protein
VYTVDKSECKLLLVRLTSFLVIHWRQLSPKVEVTPTLLSSTFPRFDRIVTFRPQIKSGGVQLRLNRYKDTSDRTVRVLTYRKAAIDDRQAALGSLSLADVESIVGGQKNPWVEIWRLSCVQLQGSWTSNSGNAFPASTRRSVAPLLLLTRGPDCEMPVPGGTTARWPAMPRQWFLRTDGSESEYHHSSRCAVVRSPTMTAVAMETTIR